MTFICLSHRSIGRTRHRAPDFSDHVWRCSRDQLAKPAVYNLDALRIHGLRLGVVEHIAYQPIQAKFYADMKWCLNGHDWSDAGNLTSLKTFVQLTGTTLIGSVSVRNADVPLSLDQDDSQVSVNGNCVRMAFVTSAQVVSLSSG